MNKKISDLEKYNPKNKERKDERCQFLKNAINFFNGRKKIIEAFEESISVTYV